MKPAIFALSLALLGAPTLASAQPAPDQQAPPQARERNPQRAQFMSQMRQLHEQLRANVLGSLTPANRQLVANVIGQLAISPTPDMKGAAARLDRALSAGERNAILQANEGFHTQSKALFEAMKASAPPPPDGQSAPEGQSAPDGNGGPPRPMGMRHQRTAGQILLGVASGAGHRF